MASLISKPKRQTLEEAVQSFRTNCMDREFEAIKKQIEDQANAMTASLATDSIPDVELARQFVAAILKEGFSLRDMMSSNLRKEAGGRQLNAIDGAGLHFERVKGNLEPLLVYWRGYRGWRGKDEELRES